MAAIIHRTALLLLLCGPLHAAADPESDRVAFVSFVESRFPNIELGLHKDGAYALDTSKREQWLEMEEFPPYEIAVDEGEIRFGESFGNGSGYADCFEDAGMGVKHRYPYFDKDRQEVVTLELAINLCREENDESPLDYMGEEINSLTAYMAYMSRGREFEITVPEEGLSAYENGKRFYYERRGQLDFACSSCHLSIVGQMLRAEVLSAAVGHATHWPFQVRGGGRSAPKIH